MAKNTRFINNRQWELLEPLIPHHKPNPKGGRPPRENRDVLEGILWILRSGARWQDLPDRYPSARRVGDDYSYGRNKVFGLICGVNFYQTLMKKN